MLKLTPLKFFCAVVEGGTVAHAAERLFCVPSNVTMRLRELEEQMNVTLFNRERNRLYVTPEGRLLYEQAREILNRVEEVSGLFTNRVRRGELRIGALDVALDAYLPQMIAHYRRQQSRVMTHLTQAPSLELERQLMGGELDLIFTDGPITHPLLKSCRAFDVQLLCVTPITTTNLSPQALVGLELYVFRKTCVYRKMADLWLEKNQVKPISVIEIESYPVTLACVEAGLGFAFVPETYMANTFSFYRNLTAHIVLPKTPVYAVWRRGDRSAVMRDFVSNVTAAASSRSPQAA
ncbi:MAG: LysR family transcriptional regulator [Burkholderiaceae bacterium]|nr:LysR family transcriptional regulator [Burkholderiaceae bacterium]